MRGNILRDGLTSLAACFILLLAAALIAPPWLDWSSWRAEIDTRLGKAIGLPVVSSGPVSVSLLPHPKLSISAVQVGQGSLGEKPFAMISRLDLALSLPALMKGEIRVVQTAMDGLDVTLMGESSGHIRLPTGLAQTYISDIALDEVTITRGRLRLVRPSGAGETMIGPVAARVSTPSLAGPWTIEAEISGEPLRLVTGVYEDGKGYPLKLSSMTPQRRIDVDGHFDFVREGGGFNPSWTGQLAVVLKRDVGSADELGQSTSSLLSAALRGGLSQGKFVASTITLDLGEAGRLEGRGEWVIAPLMPASLSLGARRLSGEALPALWQHLSSPGVATWLSGYLPPAEIALKIDQMSWSTEELLDAHLRVRIGADGLNVHEASAQFAGLNLAMSGNVQPSERQGSGEFKASAAMLQRLALSAARLGLKPEAADALSQLGRLDLAFAWGWQGDNLTFENFNATTRSGSVAARALRTPDKAEIALVVSGLDLAGAAQLASLWPDALGGRAIHLSLELKDARFGNGPAGFATLKAQKHNGAWQVQEFSASGFGGLSLTSLPPDGAGRLQARLVAPDASAVLAVAGFVLPDHLRSSMMARARFVSPLALTVSVAEQAPDRLLWEAQGQGGVAGQLRIKGSVDHGRLAALDVEAVAATRQLISVMSPLAARLSSLSPQALPLASKFGFSAMFDDQGLLSSQLIKLESQPDAARSLVASWQSQPSRNGALAGPFIFDQKGDVPVLLKGHLAYGRLPANSGLTAPAAPSVAALSLSKLELQAGQLQLKGHLAEGADGALEGELAVDAADAAQIMALAFGKAMPDAAGAWSSSRFGPPSALPTSRIAFNAAQMSVLGYVARDWRSQLFIDENALRFNDIHAALAGGKLYGTVRLGHEGSLRALGWRLQLSGADAALLTVGRIQGRADITLDGGASAETPQRLVAGMSGAGQINLTAGVFTSMSPLALGQAMSAGEIKGSAADLGRDFQNALEAGNWALNTMLVPTTITAGVLRAGPVTSVGAGAKLLLSGNFNLRNSNMELAAQMTPLVRPTPSGEEVAQASMTWRGPVHALQYEIDINGVRNVLAMRELKRELEQIEAFQADLRERSFFARRLRHERDLRERDAREREALERRLAREEALRLLGRGDASGPMLLLPLNSPLPMPSPSPSPSPLRLPLPLPLPEMGTPASRSATP